MNQAFDQTLRKGHYRRVWDLPLRIFHWSLALFFFTAWFSSEGDRWLDIHIFSGYTIMGLILFRLFWGFFGTYYAQFRHFRYSFSEARDYVFDILKGHPQSYVGHNPAGSWAIYILLSGIFLVAFSGFFVFGGDEGHGLAQSLFSEFVGDMAKQIHDVLASLMMLVIVIHVSGVLLENYQLKERLILGMLTGLKWVKEDIPHIKSQKKVALMLLLAIFIFLSSAGLGWIPGKEAFESQFTGRPLVISELWQDECNACHMAYHPSLLPASSWQTLLQQPTHFDEELGLDDATLQQLLSYASQNSAEQRVTEPARKIMQWMKPESNPLRITETRYWRRKHLEIAPEIFQQSNVNGKYNCQACHSDAEQGWFEDSKMNIPHTPQASPSPGTY